MTETITGYRTLDAAEIEAINKVKAVGKTVEDLIADVLTKAVMPGAHMPDQRWVSIGRTHLQEGFMALVRAIAKPTNF